MAAKSEQVLLRNLNNYDVNDCLLTPVGETGRRKGLELLENDYRRMSENVSSAAVQAPEVAASGRWIHHLDPGSSSRISSYRQDPAEFNLRMAETRERAVAEMVRSSQRVAQDKIEAEARRQAEVRRRELEAEERSRQSLRIQMLRGQKLDQVQASVVNYDFASLANAQADQQLATSMLTLLTSVGAGRDRYAQRLKARLQ